MHAQQRIRSLHVPHLGEFGLCFIIFYPDIYYLFSSSGLSWWVLALQVLGLIVICVVSDLLLGYSQLHSHFLELPLLYLKASDK